MGYKDDIKTYVTKLSNDRYRVEFFYDSVEYLSLYYETAKKSFVNKPVGLGGWACVEAKYSEGDIYELFPTLTPKDLMEWGQELVTLAATKEKHSPEN